MSKPISTNLLHIEVRNKKLKDLQLIEYYSFGSEIKLTFEYNKDGKKTAENINTIFQGHPSPHKFTYEYSDEGNLILEKVYSCNPHLEIEHTTEHIYNSSNIYWFLLRRYLFWLKAI